MLIEVYHAADNKSLDVAGLTLSAAFNIIDHSTLLRRLKKMFGLSEYAVAVIRLRPHLPLFAR